MLKLLQLHGYLHVLLYKKSMSCFGYTQVA